MVKMMAGKRVAAVVVASAALLAAACLVLCLGMCCWGWFGAGGEPAGVGESPAAEEALAQLPDASEDPYVDCAEGEEWPGESLGYVGPAGEGIVKREDYGSDREYLEASRATQYSISSEDEARLHDITGEEGPYYAHSFEQVTDENGYRRVVGFLTICFDRTYGEYRARQIVEALGGIWIADTFAWDTGDDLGTADAYFPGGRDDEVVAALEARPEVMEVMRAVFGASELDDAGAADAAVAAGVDAGVAAAAAEAVAGSGLNDPLATGQYYLETSGFLDAWDSAKCEGSATIAVLDNGIDLDHEDLSPNVLAADAYDATLSAPLSQDHFESQSHGTMVAGVAAAVAGNGVGVAGCSYNARILPMKIRHDEEGITGSFVLNALRQIQAMPDKPDVVNMSFSGPERDLGTPAIRSAISSLRNTHRVVFTAAVGNYNTSEVRYPAGCEGVVGVGALDESGDYRWHEAYEGGGVEGSNFSAAVDVCAPGYVVLTTTNPAYMPDGESYSSHYLGSVFVSGTSFAAPQVAAAAALVKAAHPGWSAPQVEQAITSTCVRLAAMTDVGADGRDTVNGYGFGRLDAAAAVAWEPTGTGGGSGGSPALGGSILDAYRESGAGR